MVMVGLGGFLYVFQHITSHMASQLFTLQTKYPVVERKPGFVIIGNGAIGGKAGKLLESKELIERAGWKTARTVVAATDIASAFTVPVTKDLFEINESSGHERLVLEACRWVKPDYNAGVIVRSSHETEHEGSGRYFSGHTTSDARLSNDYGRTSAMDLMTKVVQSSGDGKMAVMIQELLGGWQTLRLDMWGCQIREEIVHFPLIAGAAWTTRLGKTNDGKIVIVNGLGTKAVMVGGDTHFFDASGKMRQTEQDPVSGKIDVLHDDRIVGYELFWEDHHGHSRDAPEPKDADFSARLAAAKRRALEQLPELLKRLEKETGGPKYVEFALGKDDALYCVQLHDYAPLRGAEPKFTNAGRLLARSAVVSGMQSVTVPHVVWGLYENPRDWRIDKVNAKLDSYVLVLRSGLFSENSRFRICPDQISNCKGIIVICEHANEAYAGTHVREMFGKRIPFMVTSSTALFDMLALHRTWGDDRLSYAKLPLLFEVDEGKGIGQLRMLPKR
jgi:hypothetical protein